MKDYIIGWVFGFTVAGITLLSVNYTYSFVFGTIISLLAGVATSRQSKPYVPQLVLDAEKCQKEQTIKRLFQLGVITVNEAKTLSGQENI